jgi:prepilin-type N-terminal cleavage/methylation domain-containing protein
MKKQAFSLVELIVVVVILAILSSIWLSTYSDSTVRARDTTRELDISEVLVKFKEERLNWRAYPTSTQPFNISIGTGNIIAKQGPLLSDISLTSASKIPSDPKSSKPYIISTRTNGREFQIAGTYENDWLPKSFVRGDFVTSSPKLLPSLIVASTGAIDMTNSNSWKFVLHGSMKNFVLNHTNYLPIIWHTSNTWMLNEIDVKIATHSFETTGLWLYEKYKIYGTGYYLMTSSTGAKIEVLLSATGGAL